MSEIEDKRPEWLTAARVLVELAHFTTRTAYDEDIDDMNSKCHFVIMFDQVSRETSFIHFLMEMEMESAIECGFRPIAMEVSEEEDQDYKCIALKYFDEPTVEDEAIIDSLFISDLGVKVSA
jgi:hypothetical protein